MTTWIPALLAFVLVAVEVRRLVLGHLRREERRALIARATILVVGVPAVFAWCVGMDIDTFGPIVEVSKIETPWIERGQRRRLQVPGDRMIVVKISYRRGKLWVANV